MNLSARSTNLIGIARLSTPASSQEPCQSTSLWVGSDRAVFPQTARALALSPTEDATSLNNSYLAFAHNGASRKGTLTLAGRRTATHTYDFWI